MFNMRTGRSGGRLTRTALAGVATALLLTATLRADVVGRGDVTPAVDLDGIMVPDLPQFGGTVDGTITIGGTGDQIGGTDAGEMRISIPQDTDPLVSDDGVIGGTAAGSGVVQIDSLNSEWRLNNSLIVGDAGVGLLDIQTGARVTSNFEDMTAGPDPDMIIGAQEGSQGFVTVAGFNSTLKHRDVSVGEEGHGRLEILDFARVETTNEAFIGREKENSSHPVGGVGTVIVDGLGTRWNIGSEDAGTENDLTVGDEGRGTLEIRNSAWVRVLDDAFVGVENASYGEVTVAGQGSLWWVVDDMSIGTTSETTARGQLFVNNQGVVRADGSMTVSALGRVDMGGVQSDGSYVRGGTLLTPTLTNNGVIRGDGRIESTGVLVNSVTGAIRSAAASANHRERLLVTGPVENDGVVESNGGEMEFESNVTNNPGGQIFGRDAVLRFRGGLTQNGSLFLDDSTLDAPGGVVSAANLTVDTGESFLIGDLQLAGSNDLVMTLGDDHSQFHVTGEAILAGGLSLSLDDGFMPLVGESFQIITADLGVTGTFDSEAFPEISGIGFDVIYNPDEVLVNVVGGDVISADFNGDGAVDGDDLGLWEPNFGTLTGATRATGDANGDGDVDGRDFLTWQRQFGGPAPASSLAAAVPEPSAAMLALVGLALCGRRRRR